ncbi:MAG: sigma-70 family RNA polymerase sigma factor [Deltaproteobacteria bacterium]|nr:sigma-70 family RNA polymerase sigma factor [Deltaproteobacteria bacterium]
MAGDPSSHAPPRSEPQVSSADSAVESEVRPSPPVSAAAPPADAVQTFPPPAPIETAIREALTLGDVRAALTLATTHYRGALIRFCLAFVHDEVTAEDVAQTAFAVAAERAADFSGQSTFRTWLFGIARHKALDAAAARQGMPLSQVSDSRWIADAIGPVTGLQRAEDLETLDQVLAALGDETRALLTLRFREELSYKEIADTFEITEQAARKRMFDALEKIRKLLAHRRADFFDRK